MTGHHLNDCIETWIFGCANGQPKLIPHIRGKYIRPFLTSSRKDIDEFAINNNVEWIEDESNAEVLHRRNYIRHEVVPLFKKINPGIEKVILKKILQILVSEK
jgi:tRNA(Ile)-lysidine synthase